ncbi:unnamed protein product [Allacma fusca]|uniref:Uncharacterized protein n=1 Tax=Allacma fusca TaxID=39272 RepID=A0A8J2LJE5_9HEXA|nr:unnamed protein product [Allacma fusca]
MQILKTVAFVAVRIITRQLIRLSPKCLRGNSSIRKPPTTLEGQACKACGQKNGEERRGVVVLVVSK